MGDRHLEAAAEALARNGYWKKGAHGVRGGMAGFAINNARPQAAKIVTAYLDSLLGELPAEAVEAAAEAEERSHDGADPRIGEWEYHCSAAIRAFLQSLRDSLASGQGQGQQHEG